MPKYITNPNIRNIRLILLLDPEYLIYLSQFKKEKKSDVVYNTPAQKKSDVMSYLFEMVIMEWVKKSNIYSDNRIISYEHGHGQNTKRIFKEVDYVLKEDENYFIGEIKVSSSSNGMVPKACSQLAYSKDLLSNLTESITMQIIRIDLNFNHPIHQLDEFNDNFQNSKFNALELDGNKFKILYLSAQDVFNYGVRNNIINSPEIFGQVIYETELLHQHRQTKIALNDIRKMLNEETNPVELENILKTIDQQERSLFLIDIEIDLSQNGWVYLTKKDEVDYTFIIDYLGKNIRNEIQCESFCKRTNGFGSEDQKIRYVSYYCYDEESEFMLIDADRVYRRLSDEEGNKLQNIKFIVPNSSELEKVSYPLLNKNPYRKFYYSNDLLHKEDGNSKSLNLFEHVINISFPVEITLKPNDILIFDNHRMLHKTSNISSNILIKKIILDHPQFVQEY